MKRQVKHHCYCWLMIPEQDWNATVYYYKFPIFVICHMGMRNTHYSFKNKYSFLSKTAEQRDMLVPVRIGDNWLMLGKFDVFWDDMLDFNVRCFWRTKASQINGNAKHVGTIIHYEQFNHCCWWMSRWTISSCRKCVEKNSKRVGTKPLGSVDEGVKVQSFTVSWCNIMPSKTNHMQYTYTFHNHYLFFKHREVQKLKWRVMVDLRWHNL